VRSVDGPSSGRGSTPAGKAGGPFQQLHAELIAAGRSAFAHSLTAAALHESAHKRGADRGPDALDIPWHGAVDVAVERGGSGRRPRRRVPTQHITTVAGLRCTDGLLTLLDLASVVDARRWEHALEASLRYGLTTITEIEEALAAPGRRDREAVRVVAAVLAMRPHDAAPTGSLLETLFVQLAREHCLPVPARQHRVDVSPTKRYFVDLAWPAHRFFLELDGRDHAKQQLHDADRLAAIVATTGWSYITLTWPQVVGTPTRTAARVGGILAARAAA
jgi:very-short-patch-repair endonuclease